MADRVADHVPGAVWSDLEHHGYLRVDVRPEELRADWIATEPGDDPVAPWTIASKALRPELPIVLRDATPSSSPTSFHDVRRPSLPLPERTSPPDQGARAALGRHRRRVLVVLATGAAMVVVAGAVARRRRRR